MRNILTVILAVGLSGFGLQVAAQQKPGNQSSRQQQANADSNQSAQTFQGKIERSGSQLVFQEASSQTAYQLDDQSKVAPYEGKSVKLMATVDPKTNSLHVIDIAPAESK